MVTDSRKDGRRETKAERYGPESIELGIRERVRDVIERIVEEEVEAALGAQPSERVGAERHGYRHGHRERSLTTSVGATTIAMPRARLQEADGSSREWQSRTVRRYERRTKRVDEAILGVYLSGINTRRIKGALAPLLRGGPLSKDAVSRLVGRLAADFKTWRERDLAQDDIRYLFLDGWYPKVRLGRRRVRVPVLVTLGVRGNGQRVLLDMQLAGDESSAAWSGVMEGLVRRHIGTPALAVIDGNPGLVTALHEQWPGLPIQRCTVHKLRNLEAKAPAHLREELAEDYRRMIYGKDREAIDTARAAFRKKWQRCCPNVVTSLEEAGEDLFTFTAFPPPSGRRCAPATRWSASTASFVAARRRRRACPVRTPCFCCSSVCCTAGASRCDVWTGGRTCLRRRRGKYLNGTLIILLIHTLVYLLIRKLHKRGAVVHCLAAE